MAVAAKKPRKPKYVSVGEESVLLEACVKVGTVYVLKEDAVVINGKWYKKSEVFYDNRLKEYFAFSVGLHLGIINFVKNENGVFESVIGHFSQCPYFHCIIYEKGHRSYCMDYRILPPEYKEMPNNMNTVYTKDSFKVIKERFKFENNGYNIEDCGDYESKKTCYKNFDTKISNSVKKASKLLGNFTFGCESETMRGILPNEIQNQLGVVICKDGSIEYSPEFVTVPYQYEKGLQSLKNFHTELQKRCTSGSACSLHYHFGNTRKDREFILALHKLFSEIQEELFEMFPYYKRHYKGYKKQNYNKPLVNLIPMYDKNSKKTYKEYVNDSYCRLYEYLNMGHMPGQDFNRKLAAHSQGQHKWMIKTR